MLIRKLFEKVDVFPHSMHVMFVFEDGLEFETEIVGSDPKHKIKRLLDFTSNSRDIADPWYTGYFDQTYEDIYEGCEALLDYILKSSIL